LRLVKESNVELTRFLYVDNDGVIRGHATTTGELEGDLESGHNYSAAMPFFSALDELGPETQFGCVGEFSAVPDLDTFKILPYVPNAASLICDFVTKDTHQPTGICARSILKEFLSRTGFNFKVSFENEFYLLKRDDHGCLVPYDQSLCFSTNGMNESHQIILDTIRALQEQGIGVEKHHPEYGPGQHEIVCKYDDALKACDNQVIFRETARGVARNHGVVASFMPKPFQNLAGSGAHIHLSLWKDGQNLFYDRAGQFYLSDTARCFIGGILNHIRALCAFTASTVTSYKRLVPHNWASAYGCYGPDNREAAVRVVAGSKGKAERFTNLEFKPIDGACNPYLALAAVLAAGMDGLQRKTDPGAAVLVDPESLGAAERKARGICRLPETLGEAIEALKEDQLFEELLGEVMFSEYIKLKRFDWLAYNRQVSQWEIDRYSEIF